MYKACSCRLDKMDERLGLLEESWSSINAMVRTIQKAIESSSASIIQVVQSKVNICSIDVIG